MAGKPIKRGKGRPIGTAQFGGGIVRFTATRQQAEGIAKYQKRAKEPNASEAVRKLVQRGLEAEGLL